MKNNPRDMKHICYDMGPDAMGAYYTAYFTALYQVSFLLFKLASTH